VLIPQETIWIMLIPGESQCLKEYLKDKSVKEVNLVLIANDLQFVWISPEAAESREDLKLITQHFRAHEQQSRTPMCMIIGL